MRAKLIKSTGNHYDLRSNGELIASTYQWVSTDKYKLSKENCNELFGVVDVEKLAKDFYETRKFESSHIADPVSFKIGFNKAMELNNKVFTLEDVILIAEYVRVASQSTPNERTKNLVDEYLSTQPTEIDVEIESKIAIDGHTILGYELDSEGCLILKKI